MEHCKEALLLIDEHVLPFTKFGEGQLIVLKMKGDFSRYLAEYTNERADHKKWIEQTNQAYNQGIAISKSVLDPCNFVRVGLCVNYSIFVADIEKNYERAIELARSTLEEIKEYSPGTKDA